MPYQCRCSAAADLVVPVNNYNAPAVVQLRDLNNKLVKMGTTAVSNQVGTASANKTSWRVERTTGSQPASPLRLGDEVYLRSMNDNGATYLSNSGDLVTFTVVSGTPPNTVKWRLDTTDAVRYPVRHADRNRQHTIILTNYLSRLRPAFLQVRRGVSSLRAEP